MLKRKAFIACGIDALIEIKQIAWWQMTTEFTMCFIWSFQAHIRSVAALNLN